MLDICDFKVCLFYMGFPLQNIYVRLLLLHLEDLNIPFRLFEIFTERPKNVFKFCKNAFV